MILQHTEARVALNRTQFWYKKLGQWCWSCLHELRFDIELAEASYIRVFGNVNLLHRNNVVGPVGYALKATVRSEESFAAMPAIPTSSVNLPYWQSVESTSVIPGSKDGANIYDITDHYASSGFRYALELDAGCHRIEHWGNSHTSAGVEDSAYIELNQNDYPDAADPYSMLFLEVYQ